LIPSEEGRRQGITEAILAQQVLGSFYGNLAQRVRVGRDSAEMRVQFPNSARESFEGFDDLMVRSPAGHFFPLGEIAKIERTMGPSKITRRDRERAVLISAGVSGNTNAREIIQATMAHFSDLSQTHPGVELVFGGDHKTTQESLDSLAQALGMAAIIIWFLLAFLFRSYALPFVVMAGIPFAFLGVVFGFTAIGQPLTFMAMLGGLALTGIAVNDALVLVDFIRRHRLEGHGRLAAVLRAGTVRMRPVLITSITTIGGLMPLAFFSTGQARFLAPMAKAMVFGMLSATLMTLLLIPVGYLLLGDVRKVVFRMLGMKPRPMA
ncbi:MAG: efflux RND transporter permease subunit, partial [Planctomycetes bacterium]|nr:efflux RND transporter permease subunit [Planctomycetota bacterium]